MVKAGGQAAKHGIGKGMAFADGDRGQVDAVGDIAHGKDRGHAVCDQASTTTCPLRPNSTPRASSPRPVLLGRRPVA